MYIYSRLALTQDDLTSLNVVILNYDGPTQVFSPSIFSKIPSSNKYPLLTYSYDISIVDIGRRTYALATSVNSPHGDGLQIVDISYPKKPTPVTAIFDNSSTITNFTHLDNLFAVHTVKFGSETYALTASYTEGVEIINITDPKFPTVVPYSIYLPRNAYDITTMEINSKTYALILFGNHQMRIIDITNPASITHVSTTNDGVNSINLRNPRSIDVVNIDSNTYAITISTNSIQIMNVTVPESPVAVWHILESPNTFGFFSSIGITNIASSIFALYSPSYSAKISNITNIDDPSYETIDAVSPIYPTGIDTITVEAFTYAVVGDSNSIRIIDITNPSWTILNSTFSDTSSTYLEYPTDVAIADIDHNMYALVSNYAGSSSGIQMLTLTDNPDIYPPSILDLTISSDNVNSTLATVNDTITINLIVNEKISTVSSTVLGDTPIIDLSENMVTLTYVSGANYFGNAIFEISLMDDANNILYVTQANLTSSNIFIDPYDPIQLNLSINSSNNNPAYAKTNDVITVVLNTDEPINNVSATMLGRTPNITVFNDTVVMYTTVLQNDIDNATFSITAFDFAGNSLNVSQHDLNSTNVLIDNVSPYSTILTINSTNPNTSYAKTTDTITVTLIANEILSNATSVILGRNSNVMLSNNIVITNMSIMDGDDGNATFAIIISDLAGNMHSVTESDLDSDNIIIDTIAPSKINLTISNNFNSAMATTGNILNITLETNEIIVDATATILNRPANYIIQNDTVYASTTVQKNDPNENTTFAISVFDPSGNYLSVTKSDLDSNNIIIDTIAPSITNLMLSSNNANSTRATLDDIVTITTSLL